MMLIAHTENYFTPILTSGPLRPTLPVQGVQRRAGCHSYFMISAYESTVPQSSGPGQQDFDKAERENERAYFKKKNKKNSHEKAEESSERRSHTRRAD